MNFSSAIATIYISLFFYVLPQSAAAGLSANEIVKRADRVRTPPGSVSFEVETKDLRGNKVLRTTRYKVSTTGIQSSLVETIAPERQRGRKLLMLNDDLWFYTPDIKRPTRVSFQQRLNGEIANGDLARADFAGDYDAKIIGRETLNGHPVYKLKLTANRKSVTYSAIHYWVRVKDLVPIKADFLTAEGKILKVGTYSEVKTVLGKKTVTKIVMRDGLNPDRSSILNYSSFRREQFDESFFSKESLSE